MLWQTDNLGFRNTTNPKQGGIVLIGDSNIAGNSINQHNTIANRLANNSGLNVYNVAPCHFNDFIFLIENKIIPKPKLVIQGIIERNIPKLSGIETLEKNYLSLKLNNTFYTRLAILYDRMISKKCFKNYINARFKTSTGRGKKSKTHEGLLFLQGKKANLKVGRKKLVKHAERIKEYSDFCQNKEIDYIFLPIPNKETVYYEDVPFKTQPNYLNRLYKELSIRNVATIKSLSLFNKYKHEMMLYHLDDSHWNKFGIEITANEISNTLNNQMVK